jgi:hypothetical protein
MIELPLSSFHDCETTGSLLDYSSGADSLPDFTGHQTDGAGYEIEFDATGGSPDQDAEICAQFLKPVDYVSGGNILVLAAKPTDSGASESVRVMIAADGNAPGTPSSISVGSGLTEYGFGKTFPAGSVITLALSVTSSSTMNDPVRLHAVGVQYTARQ